jgi:hypothetical protein
MLSPRILRFFAVAVFFLLAIYSIFEINRKQLRFSTEFVDVTQPQSKEAGAPTATSTVTPTVSPATNPMCPTLLIKLITRSPNSSTLTGWGFDERIKAKYDIAAFNFASGCLLRLHYEHDGKDHVITSPVHVHSLAGGVLMSTKWTIDGR